MTSIKVPPLGESIVEATVSRWLKNEGDAVASGDTLVELETDKITVEVPSVTSGVLTRRFAKEGDVVKLDQMLAEVDEKAAPQTADRKADKPADTKADKAADKSAESSKAESREPKAESREPRADVRASPAAQRAAAETGADLSKVQGTGRGGVVSKTDVVEQKPGTADPSRALGMTGASTRAPSGGSVATIDCWYP